MRKISPIVLLNASLVLATPSSYGSNFECPSKVTPGKTYMSWTPCPPGEPLQTPHMAQVDWQMKNQERRRTDLEKERKLLDLQRANDRAAQDLHKARLGK